MGLLITDDRKSLSLELASGIARFHAVWLRDNSLHPDTKSAGNGQRLISLLDQPLDITIKEAVIEQGVLKVEFSDGPAQHRFSVSWLDEHRYDKALSGAKGWNSLETKLWGAELNQTIPSQSYEAVENNSEIFKQWLSDVRCYGFALITGLPDHPEAFLKVVAWFGYIRETN